MTAATITGSTPHAPDLFLIYSWRRKINTRSREIPGTANRAHTLRPAGLRTGRFSAFFVDIAAAVSLDNDLKQARTFTLADTDRPAFNMTFIMPQGGSIDLQIDDKTRDRWTVTFDFEEI